jgi:hypothetical protein
MSANTGIPIPAVSLALFYITLSVFFFIGVFAGRFGVKDLDEFLTARNSQGWVGLGLNLFAAGLYILYESYVSMYYSNVICFLIIYISMHDQSIFVLFACIYQKSIFNCLLLLNNCKHCTHCEN